MVDQKEGLSTAESLRKTRTYGQVRCHNPSCMGRLQPQSGVNQVKCPACGMEYRRGLDQRVVFLASEVRCGM